jgi:hypothetical protein
MTDRNNADAILRELVEADRQLTINGASFGGVTHYSEWRNRQITAMDRAREYVVAHAPAPTEKTPGEREGEALGRMLSHPAWGTVLIPGEDRQ